MLASVTGMLIMNSFAGRAVEGRAVEKALAGIMHKFSTAATKSSALTVLRDPQAGTPGLLNVPTVRLRGPPTRQAGAPAPSQAAAFVAS